MKTRKELEKEKKRSPIGVLILVFLLVFGSWFLIFYFYNNFVKVNCESNPPMTQHCEKYNIEELPNCVREGYTGKGILGFTDFNTVYYVCEGYGRVARTCIDWSEPSPSNLTADWRYCK